MIQKHKFENHDQAQTKNPFINRIQDIFKTKYDFNDNLENLHEILETHLISQQDKEYHKQIHGWNDDRNSIFIKHFHQYVDNNPTFNETYHQFIKTHIFPLFPNETKLVIQKTPNIRFSFPETAAIGCDPNDPENIIGLHSDSNFGHNENEMNFIIPITKMFSSNSIYYETTIGSQVEPQKFENLELETDEFLQAYFNKLRHCNHINKTNKTRISFDMRIIPHSKYMDNLDFFEGTKFELGKYYVVMQCQ